MQHCTVLFASCPSRTTTISFPHFAVVSDFFLPGGPQERFSLIINLLGHAPEAPVTAAAMHSCQTSGLEGRSGSSRSHGHFSWSKAVWAAPAILGLLVVMLAVSSTGTSSSTTQLNPFKPAVREGPLEIDSLLNLAATTASRASSPPPASPPLSTAAATIVGELGVQTDAPMRVLPPFEPTCIAPDASMEQMGCPLLDCRRDKTCHVRNPTCCAFINFEVLSFIDRSMTLKCLQHEWLVLYGTSLGAMRNQTILPHTEDVDIGLTPLGVQFRAECHSAGALAVWLRLLASCGPPGLEVVPSRTPPLT